MTQRRPKKHEVRWKYPDKTGGKQKDDYGGVHMGVVLPNPLTNPLTFTANVTGCNNVVAITATLSDDTGATINSAQGSLPPPSTVTVSAPTAGDYTLTVELQCGSNYLSLTFDVDLPAPPPPHKC